MDMSLRFHERLKIAPEDGEMRDGAIRYLMMRPDALMGMFARLGTAARAEAFAALTASVADHGGRSVKAYHDSGAADPEALMQTIIDTSAELGWGLWSFERKADDLIEVTVRNSPFADGHGPSDTPVCAPICGILTAMGPLLMEGRKVTVGEAQCHAVSSTGDCRFTIRS